MSKWLEYKRHNKGVKQRKARSACLPLLLWRNEWIHFLVNYVDWLEERRRSEEFPRRRSPKFRTFSYSWSVASFFVGHFRRQILSFLFPWSVMLARFIYHPDLAGRFLFLPIRRRPKKVQNLWINMTMHLFHFSLLLPPLISENLHATPRGAQLKANNKITLCLKVTDIMYSSDVLSREDPFFDSLSLPSNSTPLSTNHDGRRLRKNLIHGTVNNVISDT